MHGNRAVEEEGLGVDPLHLLAIVEAVTENADITRQDRWTSDIVAPVVDKAFRAIVNSLHEHHGLQTTQGEP